MTPEPDRTSIYYLRRGTLYGAALGLLLGLAAIAVEGYEGRQAVAVWRNWILAGACLGLFAGTIRGFVLKPRSDDDQNVSPRP